LLQIQQVCRPAQPGLQPVDRFFGLESGLNRRQGGFRRAVGGLFMRNIQAGGFHQRTSVKFSAWLSPVKESFNL